MPMKIKRQRNEDQDLNLVRHRPYLLSWLCVMAGSLLDVIQTRMKLIGTRTQIYIPPLYYSIEFILLYHQMHEDNLKSNSREKNVQFNTI